MRYLKRNLILVLSFSSINISLLAQDNYHYDGAKWFEPVKTAVKFSGNYPHLPQKTIEINHPPPKEIRTHDEILTLYPNIQVLPSQDISQTETPLVSGRANPNFLFGSSNAISNSAINSGSYISVNGGYAWTGNDFINNGNQNNQRGDPAPVIDKNNRVIFTHLTSNVVFGNVNGVGAEYSTDYGQNFSTTFQISVDANADKNAAGTDDSPLSPFYGNSYCAWTTFSSNPVTGRFSRTTNGGDSWTAPLVLNSTPAGYIAQGHDIDVLPNGNVIVCWALAQISPPYTEKFIGLAKSTNGGINFISTEEIYSVNGIRTTSYNGWGIRTNSFPKISIDKSGGARNGWIYIVTCEINNPPAGNDADIILHRSTDGGNTWLAGIRVNRDAMNNGKAQFFPCIRVDENGGINIAYYDNRNFPSSGDSCSVFISRSIDGGNTWSDIEVADHHFKPKIIPGGAGGYMGDYIGITSGNGRIWAFWTDDKSGTFNAWAGMLYEGSQPLHDISCGPFIGLPSIFTVNQSYQIKANIFNAGSSNENNAPVNFYINGALSATRNININSGSFDTVNVSFTPVTAGIYNFMFISDLPTDTNRLNDTVKAVINVIPFGAPICEGFNPSAFPPANWNIVYTGTNFWSRQNLSAFCSGTGSAKYDFYDSPSGTQQQMITSTFPAANGNADSLTFYDAYCTYQTENDQLQISGSTDGGTTWNSLVTLNGGTNGQLVTAPPQTLPFSPACSQWRRQSVSLPNGTNRIRFNTISAFGNNLYIDSICFSHLIGIKKVSNNVPVKYYLSQNYPNPFNPATSIIYELPEAGFIKLVIYDILGNEIATLVNEKQQAGIYHVDWDAANLASGIYFYSLTSASFNQTKRMVLLK